MPHLGREKVGRGIEGLHQPPLVLFDDRLQLEDVTHQQELFASEGLAHVPAVDAEHFVYEVNDVCPHHGYLVDDDEFQFAEQLQGDTTVLERFTYVAWGIARVVGQQRMERQFEEGVQRLTPGIDSGNTGRGEYDIFLLGLLGYIAQKSRLTRPCLSRKKERATGVLDNLEGLLPLLIVKV